VPPDYARALVWLTAANAQGNAGALPLIDRIATRPAVKVNRTCFYSEHGYSRIRLIG
jgi:hypothetical protein